MKIEKSQPKTPKTTKISKPPKKKPLSLQQLIARNPNFQLTATGKLRCKLTNHEMPPTPEALESHLNSKSYKRGLQSQYDISEYELILVDFKGDPKYYYCQLTGAKVAKKKSAVERHLQGKRFQRLFQELKKNQEEELALGALAVQKGEAEEAEEGEQQQIEQGSEQQQEEQPSPQPEPPKKPKKKPQKNGHK